jgi:hypothetical protein
MPKQLLVSLIATAEQVVYPQAGPRRCCNPHKAFDCYKAVSGRVGGRDYHGGNFLWRSVMRGLMILALATGLFSCQMDGPAVGNKSSAEVAKLKLPKALQRYETWSEVTHGPRKVVGRGLVRAWTLCRAPLPGEQLASPPNPHGNKFTRIYADTSAWHVIRGKDRWLFKPGSTIVKTKGVEDSRTKVRTLVAIGAMIKRNVGYDPTGGDWEYVYAQLDKGQVVSMSRGKLQSCKACHGPRKTRDHLYMPYLNVK